MNVRTLNIDLLAISDIRLRGDSTVKSEILFWMIWQALECDLETLTIRATTWTYKKTRALDHSKQWCVTGREEHPVEKMLNESGGFESLINWRHVLVCSIEYIVLE
jgi:hypothetical protein